MVHRPADSRLLSNLLQQEKEYSKQLNVTLDASNASLASFAAYAAASPPPVSQVIMAIAGSLAAVDDALRRYVHGVDEWREAMRQLKDLEEEVGNIMRDREILVTRLIKVSKSQKNNSSTFRDSLLLSHQKASSSSLSLSVGGMQDSPSPPPSRPLSSAFSSSNKLVAAQTELQACEVHLAAKERELASKRCSLIRNGMGARLTALIGTGWAWEELGKEATRVLEGLDIEIKNFAQSQDSRVHESKSSNVLSPLAIEGIDSSDFSSIGPSQSASQVNAHYPDIPPPISMATVINQMELVGAADANTTTSQQYELRLTVVMENGVKEIEKTKPEQTQLKKDVNGKDITKDSEEDEQVAYRPGTGATDTTKAPSINNSLFHDSPAKATTYKLEPVSYAPAIALHVPPRDSPSLGAAKSELFKDANFEREILESPAPTVRIAVPAPHALSGNGYAYDIPTAAKVHAPESSVAGFPSQGRPSSRSSSTGGSSSKRQKSEYKGKGKEKQTHLHRAPVFERRITEEEVSAHVGRNGIERKKENDTASSIEEEILDEKRLLEEGKLEVVENPRFMSETRKKELENLKQREKETEKKRAMEEAKFLKAQPNAAREDEVEERSGIGAGKEKEKEKKRFSLFQSHSHTANSPRLNGGAVKAQSAGDFDKGGQEKVSPTKSGFLGSIREFFLGDVSSGAKTPSPRKPTQPKTKVTPSAVHASVDSSDDNSDVEAGVKRYGGGHPTGRGLHEFFLGGGKDGQGRGHNRSASTSTGAKWETRTDKNIQQLSRRESFDGDDEDRRKTKNILLGEVKAPGSVLPLGGVATNVGLGVAASGSAVRIASTSPSPVTVGKRRKAASDIGAPSSMSQSDGGRKLKKSRAVTSAVKSDNASIASSSGDSPVEFARRMSSMFTSTPSTAVASPVRSVSVSAVSSAATITPRPKLKNRRSASVDVDSRRIPLSKQEDTDDQAGTSSGGEGMIVDLGRRRRAASEVGVSAPEGRTTVSGTGTVASADMSNTRTPARALSQTKNMKQKSLAVDNPASGRPIYGSDTETLLPTAPATDNKNSKKKRDQPSASGFNGSPRPPVTIPQVSALERPTITQTPARKPSIRSTTSTPATYPQHTLMHEGGALVLSAGGESPSGTLVSQPGWKAQSQAPGGSLSRNTSITSTSSAPSGRPGSTVSRGRKQTLLGHGMGGAASGGSPGRRSSSSGPTPFSAPPATTGHGGTLVQPAPSAPSLMSIVEDVARINKQVEMERWNMENDLKLVKKGGVSSYTGGQQRKAQVYAQHKSQATGMMEVVKAPPPVSREMLAVSMSGEASQSKTSLATVTSSHVGRRKTISPAKDSSSVVAIPPPVSTMFEIRAPGSVFIRQDELATTIAGHKPSYRDGSLGNVDSRATPVSGGTSRTTISPTSYSSTSRPSKLPLKSALKDTSRTPSPAARHIVQRDGSHDITALSLAPVAGGTALYPKGGPPVQIQSTKAKMDKGKGKASPPPDDSQGETTDSTESESYETGNEFYSEQDDEGKNETTKNKTTTNNVAPVNGHAPGYETQKMTNGSVVSQSTASTVITSQLTKSEVPTSSVISDATGPSSQVPRRRKSVRVSLQPTFSPSPPVIDYEDEDERTRYAPWGWQEDHERTERILNRSEPLPAPIPLRAPGTEPRTVADVDNDRTRDMWQDSGSDEDEEYARAKQLLSRAAKREKDIGRLVAADRARG